MDLSTIQMHLDNFVNTWEGWNNVVKGLDSLVGIKEGFDTVRDLIVDGAENFHAASSLSSK